MKSPLFFCWILVFPIAGLLAEATGAEAPPASPADSALRILEQVDPFYPQRALQEGIIRGEAQIVFLVDASGRLADHLVVAYTQEEFASSALTAIKRWKFEPARARGKPIGTVVDCKFLFEYNGMVVIERRSPAASRLDQWLAPGQYAFQPCPARLLDREPKAIQSPRPTYPQTMSEQGITGKVQVEFYIDEQGRVRLPVARVPADSLLAGLAVAAVQQWQFEPPTRGGKPVMVCASQEFTFVPAK